MQTRTSEQEIDYIIFLGMGKIPSEYSEFFFSLKRNHKHKVALKCLEISEKYNKNKPLSPKLFKGNFVKELALYDYFISSRKETDPILSPQPDQCDLQECEVPEQQTL